MSIFTIKINSFETQNEWGEPTVSTYWYAEYEATVIFQGSYYHWSIITSSKSKAMSSFIVLCSLAQGTDPPLGDWS